MNVLFYSARPFEEPLLKSRCPPQFRAGFTDRTLSADTAGLADGYDAVSIFTSDKADAGTIEKLKRAGVRYIALRSAGYDHVDLSAAADCGIRVANIPAYSPEAVAEHALLLLLALMRHLPAAVMQGRLQNFKIDHLIGTQLSGKTVGLIGLGHIGASMAQLLTAFGCTLLVVDPLPNEGLQKKLGFRYVDPEYLFRNSDVISLHVPFTPETRHLVNRESLALVKPGCLLVNTARGGLLDTQAVLEALEEGRIGGLGIDVYEKEQGVFFNDLTGTSLNDPLLERLLQHPRVIVTPHQGFATIEALEAIATTIWKNLAAWKEGKTLPCELGNFGVNKGAEKHTIPMKG